MSDLCATTFEHLAERMGFSCAETGGLFELRSPFALENWTLPVLELTIIVGSVLALVYAITRLRRHGDATNLVLWFGAIAYLLIIEPPLYFPAAFGIEEHVDTMFAHNLFTVEFMWGRLPLYIIAIYPMMATVAFEIIRNLGVFRRYGAFVGAVCVGFVHHAFYEIFDHLGPQLRWWEWSLDNPINQPFFDAVPLPSVVVFAALWPMSLAFCVQFFVGRQMDQGERFTGLQILWRTIVVGVLASLGTAILPAPATIIGAFTNTTVMGIVYALELVAISVVAAIVMVKQWQRLRNTPPGATETRYSNPLMVRFGLGYLIVLAVLWLTALPAYFGAVDGWTENGDPIGNLWYTAACFVIAGLSVAAALSVGSVKPAAQPVSTMAP